MKLIKDDIGFSISDSKDLLNKDISDGIWSDLVHTLWNDVEHRMGLRYSTPLCEHDGEWIGEIR